MKKLISLCAALVVLFSMNSTTAFAATKYSTNPDECVDGVCFVPQYADGGRQNYAIVSPVGYHDVAMIKQAGPYSVFGQTEKPAKPMKK